MGDHMLMATNRKYLWWRSTLNYLVVCGVERLWEGITESGNLGQLYLFVARLCICLAL